jgi:glucosamine--fructose-6-phosphate aminotransferase (isomerizing)
MSRFDDLLTWRESSTSGAAIAAAVEAVRRTTPASWDSLRNADRIVLTGAGSSYYLAQTVATVGREALHRPITAAPLSELLLRPAGVLIPARSITSRAEHDDAPKETSEPVVIISRSGSTSEAVEVARQMRAAGHPTIAVTCRRDSPLARLADLTLVSPAGDEAAIVMTRSFASMLGLLLAVVAAVAGDGRLAADLAALPERWSEAADAATVGRRLGATAWSRVAILGGGPAFGIATEWGLKLTETSQVPASAHEPLEFRHGPISVCEPGMLVIGIVGGPGAAKEAAVVAEAAALGASTWLIAGDPAEVLGATGEVSVIGAGLHPWARLPLLAHPGHALALELALTRGRDPDAPRHLGQVVILGPA